MRRKLLYLFVFLLLVITILVILHKKPREISIPKANILLITIDTIRPDRLSCYGSSNQTPNLDAIARDGILFENAFSQVPLTFPSHTSILTGLFPAHHGVHQNGLEVFSKTSFLLPELLRKNGYKTGAVVSSFVLDRKFGLEKGFDAYDDRMERLPGISTNFEVERPGNEVYDSAVRMLDTYRKNKWFIWLHFYDP